MSQKAQFFETVVDVLKNDYGVSVVKSDPASPLARSSPRTEHCQGLSVLGISRQAYYKRNRAADGIERRQIGWLSLFSKSGCASLVWVHASCTICCIANQTNDSKSAKIGCSRSWESAVCWCYPSGPTTRQHRACIASTAIPAYSSPVQAKSFRQAGACLGCRHYLPART